MTSDNDLSYSEFPLPVVLVIGDQREYFAERAWDGVAKKHTEAGPPVPPIEWADIEPLLDRPRPEILRDLAERGWGRQRRSKARHPIPLQIVHPSGSAAMHLHEHVTKVLDLFDVWGIIASGSAGDVEPLRDALAGVDVPLLVTTDSTAVGGSGLAPNELRLMPSNRAQATAMLFAAVRAASDEDSTGNRAPGPLRPLTPIMYQCEATTAARRYVNDLRTQLVEAAHRLGIELVKFNSRRDPYPLIGLGYEPLATKLLETRTKRRVTILSDGCATGAVRDKVYDALGPEDSRWWFLSRPETTFEYLAGESFAAIAEAGRGVLAWNNAHNKAHSDRPSDSLRDTIKRILASTDADAFQFEGIANVAPAYRVLPVAEHWEWAAPERETVAQHDTSSRPPLRGLTGGAG